MRKLIASIIVVLVFIVFLWIFIEPLAYCVLLGICIGVIVWIIKEVLKELDKK